MRRTRLTEPLVKDGAQHGPISWPDALKSAAAPLKAVPPEQTAIIASGRMTNEELFLTRALAAEIGTSRLALVPRFAEPTPCSSPPTATRTPPARNWFWKPKTRSPNLDAIREGVRSGEIKALVVLGEDLITDAGFHFSDLAKLDFLLQTHISPTHRARRPSGSARRRLRRKRGSMVNLSGRLQRLNRAVEMPGQARDDWEILRDLILALTGGKNEVHLIEDVFKALADDRRMSSRRWPSKPSRSSTASPFPKSAIKAPKSSTPAIRSPLLANERAARETIDQWLIPEDLLNQGREFQQSRGSLERLHLLPQEARRLQWRLFPITFNQ
jgi:hypothetical protein